MLSSFIIFITTEDYVRIQLRKYFLALSCFTLPRSPADICLSPDKQIICLSPDVYFLAYSEFHLSKLLYICTTVHTAVITCYHLILIYFI